jgi:hypothetical protein
MGETHRVAAIRRHESRRRRLAEDKRRQKMRDRFVERIERLWSAGAESEPMRLMHRYMTGKALRLMRCGDFEEADVLLELLPKKTAAALLDSFFPDVAP